MSVTSEKCYWCGGSGVDSESIENGSYYACVDCRGTGFLHYEAGRDMYDEELNNLIDSLENKLSLDIDEQIRKDLNYLNSKKDGN